MMKEFKMFMMRELTFFLGIQVKQIKKGTFVHQVKYTNDLMKKFNMAELKPMSTPMSMTTALDPDENGDIVDQREYRSMIGSLLYLTTTRPDIQFIVCLCARFQASSRSSHRTAVQRIFSYLKQILELRI
jgi:isopentenyldiphosphate isomerase